MRLMAASISERASCSLDTRLSAKSRSKVSVPASAMCWPYDERSPASSLTERLSVSSEWRSMPSVRWRRRSIRSLWKRLNFSGTLRSSTTSEAFVRFGLKPRMSASEAALTWFGFTGFSRAALRAADGLATTLVVLAVDSALAETVLAMALTSSRLKAIGFLGALRASRLSRRADFLDGFSMVGRFPAEGAGVTGAAALGAGGAFRVSVLDTFFLDEFTFLFLSMGSLGDCLAAAEN